MKHSLHILIFSILFSTTCFAQNNNTLLKKKNLIDTLLQERTLLMPNPFDPQKALLKLFPGQYYNLSSGTVKDELINWECKTCKPVAYNDVNEDAIPVFPFKDGVATRLKNVLDIKDSTGRQFKIITFNHSQFDEEGNQTSRFTGGLLGLAKFMLTKDGWKLTFFQPAIGAYGAFSNCPAPQLVLIGQDQYAFMIKHSNGGGGGPFDGAYYLLAGSKGAYREIMAAYNVERTAVSEEEGLCSWASKYSVPVSKKKYFRDIIITTKGIYSSTDVDALPEDVKKRVKKGKSGKFTIEQRYIFKAAGYEAVIPSKVLIN